MYIRPFTPSRMITVRLPPPSLARRDQRFDQSPFVVGQITRISQPATTRIRGVDKSLDQRRFTEALSALDDTMSSVNLRRPLMPIKLHANLTTLALKVRRVAAEEEQDRSRREAMADAALKWTDRVLGVLPSNPEACWHLD